MKTKFDETTMSYERPEASEILIRTEGYTILTSGNFEDPDDDKKEEEI